MGIMDVSAGRDAPHEVNVIIEIPAQAGPVKYELSKDTGTLTVDRFIATSMCYPANYGFIPQTLSEDGDPVDVLIVTPVPLQSGCVIKARVVGVLKMTDESGPDAKLLAVPADKLTTLYREVKTHEDLPSTTLGAIAHFFQHYKELEAGKWVKIDGWEGVDSAHAEIKASIERYNQGQ